MKCLLFIVYVPCLNNCYFRTDANNRQQQQQQQQDIENLFGERIKNKRELGRVLLYVSKNID
jgi:hypothetical protein